MVKFRGCILQFWLKFYKKRWKLKSKFQFWFWCWERERERWSFWAAPSSIWDLISNRKSLIVFQICWVKILWDSWRRESYKKTSIGNWIESFHELNIPYGSLVMDSLNLSKATRLVSFDGMAEGVAGCKHSRL